MQHRLVILSTIIILLKIATAAARRNPVVRVLENQTFSKTLFILWDVRVNTKPEFSDQTTRVNVTLDSQGNLLAAFSAFNRTWNIAAASNDFLLPDYLPADVRSINGTHIDRLSQSVWQPIRDRLYLGTVDAGNTEQGWTALMYGGTELRAYMTTNINDYMINTLIANQTILKASQSVAKSKENATTGKEGKEEMTIQLTVLQPESEKKTRDIAPANLPEEANKTEAETADGISISGSEANQHLPQVTDFVSLGPLPRPRSGYDLYAEISIFVDQTWLDSISKGFNIDRNAALVYTAEIMHYTQLWFLHPSLGYRIWLRITSFVIINGSYPTFAKENFAQLCNWQSGITVEVGSDFFLLFTGNQKNCDELSGVAYPNEACNFKLRNRQCACIYHQSLQTNTLIRTIAHEIGHLVGMTDDYSGRTSKLCYSGLMRFGVYEDSGWSTCAVQSLERFLFIKGNTCLHKSLTNTTAEPPKLPLNIAWRSRAWQSSTLDDDETSWGAWKATDGHIYGVPYENSHGSTANLLGHLSSCTQTKLESRPWLVLELDRATGQQGLLVHVYGREECCEHSLDNLTIAVGQTRQPRSHRICKVFESNGHFGKYKLLSVRCQSGSADNFISIMANGASVSLSVCEVYVFQDQPPLPFSHVGETCFDEVRYCDGWKTKGDCQTESRQFCQRTCGICRANRTKLARPKFKRQPALPQQCKDSHRNCRFYAANGLCSEKHSHCPLSCNRCEPLTTTLATMATTASSTLASADSGGCEDRSVNCEHWVRDDYCNYEHIAYLYCKRSCGNC